MTAEFALALPAVLACVALCVGAVHGAAQFGALAASAASAARLAGRGDDPGNAPTPAGTAMNVEREGSAVCVEMTASEDGPLGRIGIRLSARACALDEGIAE